MAEIRAVQMYCSTILRLGKTIFVQEIILFGTNPSNNVKPLTYANFKRITTAVVEKEAHSVIVVIKNITLSSRSM